MLRPNVKGEVSKMSGADIYGKRAYDTWETVSLAVVKLETSSRKTSVRTDASASRGSAQEILADARLLFPKDVLLTPGDRVRIHGVTLTVESIFPRYNVLGRFDHWQVDCNVYYEG